jgi:hypothetical protein
MVNWKTTLFGALAAICTFLASGFPEMQTIFAALASLFTAFLGYYAKDSNVTGGTVANK